MEKTVFVGAPVETRGGWREIEAPRLPAECGNSPVKAYKKGSCRVLLGHEDRHGTGRKRWHRRYRTLPATRTGRKSRMRATPCSLTGSRPR